MPDSKNALPETIEDSCHNTTVRWMRHLDDVHRPSSRGDVDSETQKETTSHKLLHTARLRCDSLDNGSDDDAKAAYPHTEASSVGISGGANKGE